jgi:hypothetical protein
MTGVIRPCRPFPLAIVKRPSTQPHPLRYESIANKSRVR